MLVPNVNHCHTGPQEARTTTGIGETIGNHCIGYHHPPQTTDLRVIKSSLSMALLMLSMSNISEGSWHSQHGRQHREDGAHMKINLTVFKDEDAKDAVTYQSWRWDLNSILTCRMQGLHPPTICYLVLTGLSLVWV